MQDGDDGDDTTEVLPAPSMRLVAWLGMIPFAALSFWLAAIAVDHPWRGATVTLLAGYGAVVLSFLGGVQWGAAMSEREPRRSAAWIAAVPALVGWAALLVPAPAVFALLAAAYAAQGASDTLAAHGGHAPAWYGRLRARLTLPAIAAMVLGLAATA